MLGNAGTGRRPGGHRPIGADAIPHDSRRLGAPDVEQHYSLVRPPTMGLGAKGIQLNEHGKVVSHYPVLRELPLCDAIDMDVLHRERPGS